MQAEFICDRVGLFHRECRNVTPFGAAVGQGSGDVEVPPRDGCKPGAAESSGKEPSRHANTGPQRLVERCGVSPCVRPGHADPAVSLTALG